MVSQTRDVGVMWESPEMCRDDTRLSGGDGPEVLKELNGWARAWVRLSRGPEVQSLNPILSSYTTVLLQTVPPYRRAALYSLHSTVTPITHLSAIPPAAL